MLSRSIRRSIASPLRQRFVAPAARPAFSRFVTTDAASSHAERDQVPEVGDPDALSGKAYRAAATESGMRWLTGAVR
jgi:predicted RNA-binding Zn ribbon-like protein